MTRSKLMAKRVWREADAVCFDVDSTLIMEEGIDGLAEYCGAGAQVKEWTKKAMGGAVTFQEALKARLDIIHPSLQQLEEFNNSKKPSDILTPGIQELISLLHEYGTTVYLVSGGFRSFIEPLADFLDIPRENIFANRILFDDKGEYSGFDRREPTSRSGGKPRVVQQLKEKHNKIVMIGDGMTDMEASPPAKFASNNIADFGELELSQANFKVLERSDMGPLLNEFQLAYSMAETPDPPYTPYDTQVRLVQSATGYSSAGFMEVFLHGSWGPVCHMTFDSAISACRQLGYNWSPYYEDEDGYAGNGTNKLSIFSCNIIEGDYSCLRSCFDYPPAGYTPTCYTHSVIYCNYDRDPVFDVVSGSKKVCTPSSHVGLAVGLTIFFLALIGGFVLCLTACCCLTPGCYAYDWRRGSRKIVYTHI